MCFAMLIIPLAGTISDRIGRKPLMIGTALAMLVLAHPLFRMIRHPTFSAMWPDNSVSRPCSLSMREPRPPRLRRASARGCDALARLFRTM